MITKTLLKQLCHLAKTPESIKTIRAFVLQAAMSGRLSGMAPGDTTLGDLEQIVNAERKAGGHEKKTLKAICTSDVGMPSGLIPSHWGWYKFGDIAHHNAGKMLNKGQNNTGRETEYITTSNLYWGYFKLDGLRKMPIRDDELERCTATKGDLLICEGGEAGRAAVWPHDRLIAFQNHVHRARPFGGISPYYLQLYFWKLEATGEIAKHRKGVGITSMSGKTLSEILIPLPPLAEQKRIVAKVAELMALCDRLEAQLKERDVKQAALAKAALAKFTEDPSPGNLQLLFHPSFSIQPEDLKKLVLSLVIQGRLSQQDPSEESSKATLERLLNERKKQEKSLRLKEPSPVDADEEFMVKLPKGWHYASPDQLTCFKKNALTIGPFGSSLLKSDYKSEGVPLVFVRDIRRQSFGGAETRFITFEKSVELASHTVLPGDILITKMGDPPGDTAIYPNCRPPAIITADCIKLSPHLGVINPQYLNFMLRAPQIAKQFASITAGVAQQKVSLERFRCIALPIPPLAEQLRIVIKLEQLMDLIHRLEVQLEASRTTGEKLLEAMVAELTAD